MNSLKGSKSVLALIILAMICAAFAVPIANSIANASSATTDTSTNAATSSHIPPTWFQLAPAGNLPSPRASVNQLRAYDQMNNRLIVFGGNAGSGNGTFLNDTWVLVGADGTTAGPQWIQLNTVNPPSPRVGAAGVYDAVHNMLIIFGGCINQSCAQMDNSVYVLSNANGLGGTPTWTQLSPTGGPPAPRAQSSAVYDSTNNELIIFGGYDSSNARYNDTWVLSNANGLGNSTPIWTQLNTVDNPPVRVSQSAVYDTANNILMIFGGSDCCGNPFNDTWVLSNANGLGSGTPTWTQLSPSGVLPPARVNEGAVYDDATNHMIIFGGSNTSGSLNSVWILSHANGLGGKPSWKQAIPVSTSPLPWDMPVVNYRASTGRLVVFGGANANGNLNETWVLMDIH